MPHYITGEIAMTPLPFFQYSLYEMYMLFLIWSFIGWGIEVCYMTIETGEYQNRGFLNMPICPIYGFGVLLIVTIFRPINHTFFPLLVGSSILCTSFELSVGLLMELVFHNRWWDYSHERFNFKGLICLKVAILWGMGCVIVVRIVNPLFEIAVRKLPTDAGFVVIIVSAVLIALDLTASIISVNKFNIRLKQLDSLSQRMLSVSVAIGGVLASGTNTVVDNYDKIKEKTDETTTAIKEKTGETTTAIKEKLHETTDSIKEKAAEKLSEGRAVVDEYRDTYNKEYAARKEKYTREYEELKAKYEQLLSKHEWSDRIIKAFPTIRNSKYSGALRDLKHRITPSQTEYFELRLDEVKKIRKSDKKNN